MGKRVGPAVCAALMALGAHAAEVGEARLYECARTPEPPVIDGRLTEVCWQQAAKTGAFVRVLRGPERVPPTQCQLAYDEGRLYLAVTCFESAPQAVRTLVSTGDDANVMSSDDCIEVFLRPNLSRPEYYQFAANSIGTCYDARGFDPSWNSHWKAAATVGRDAWYLECAFDFASLGRFGTPGAVWGLNVCRDRYAGGEADWSSWSLTPTGFHAPERFGKLIFGGQPGGADRAVLIECARYAQLSIDLEAKISDALATIGESDLGKLEAKERADLAAHTDAAEKSVKALRELTSRPSILDAGAWAQVVAELETAARGLDEAAWTARFEKLLADD